MKKKLLIPALLLAVLTSCNQTQSETNLKSQNTKTMEKQDKLAIEALLQEYKKALNTSDAQLATSLYTKEGIFMPTEAPSAIGAENIQKSYAFIFTQIQLNIEFYIEEIMTEGNLAFATTSSKGTTLIHATGDTVPEENRELFVFEKVDEVWKIARYIFNKTSPKQLEPNK